MSDRHKLTPPQTAEQEGRAEVQRGDWSGVHFVYHKPAGGNGVITELIQLTELSREVFDLVRQEAADWDGKDPVRSLMSQPDGACGGTPSRRHWPTSSAPEPPPVS